MSSFVYTPTKCITVLPNFATNAAQLQESRIKYQLALGIKDMVREVAYVGAPGELPTTADNQANRAIGLSPKTHGQRAMAV